MRRTSRNLISIPSATRWRHEPHHSLSRYTYGRKRATTYMGNSTQRPCNMDFPKNVNWWYCTGRSTLHCVPRTLARRPIDVGLLAPNGLAADCLNLMGRLRILSDSHFNWLSMGMFLSKQTAGARLPHAGQPIRQTLCQTVALACSGDGWITRPASRRERKAAGFGRSRGYAHEASGLVALGHTSNHS